MATERLWAPWRLEYIKGEKPDECVFCAAPTIGNDEEALIVARGRRAFVILNAFPYNNGHVMVAPFDHIAKLEALDADVVSEMMALAQRMLGVLGAAYGPEGYNIGINQGKVAGAGIETHLHLHVVPRWGADTNFMPVLSDTRVLPQKLNDSWREIRESWAGSEER